MELDEMKTLWTDMSQQLEAQKVLTDKMIVQMTQQRYTSKLQAISIPEIIGAVICFATVLFITGNFGKLDTWYLQLSGGLTALACLILPILSLRSLQQLRIINISKATYREALVSYLQSKNHFMKLQRITYYLSFFLILVMLPVMGKLLSGVDVITEDKDWIWIAPAAVPLFYFFAKWVYKKYQSTTAAAEEILRSLDEE